LHTYFQVADVRGIGIHGLDGCRYLDKLDGELKQQAGPLVLNGELDRVYSDQGGDCLINDPGLQRRIRIAKQGSHSTIVWNPWSEKAAKLGDMNEEGYLGMVCVESANAGEDVVSLEPGAEHRLRVEYSVEGI
jgi:D-hexose-6-phosphate mutarotase